MVAGPQIVTAILLATGMRPRRDSAFFLLGAGVATFLGVTGSYFLTGLLNGCGAALGGDSRVERAIEIAIVVLLVFLAWKVSRERGRSQPPRWMAKLESATPFFSLRIGFLLFLLLLPGPPISMFTVGAYLAHHGAPWWHGLVFVAVTVSPRRHSSFPSPRSRRAGEWAPAEGPRLDDEEFVDRQRDRDRVLSADDVKHLAIEPLLQNAKIFFQSFFMLMTVHPFFWPRHRVPGERADLGVRQALGRP